MAARASHLTRRLRLDPPRLADVPALFAFMGDPEAMAHTHPRESLRDCRRYVAVHERQRRRTGIAPWTIRERETGRIVGWGGLYEDIFDPGWGVEVVYFFHPDVWGRGYATELTEAAVAFGRERGLTAVVAFAHPDNLGSRRVLEKSGFVEERFLPDAKRFFYRLALLP